MSDESNELQISTSPLRTVQEALENFSASANVDAVFHDPIKHGDNLIIPAAEVFSVMGFGVGTGNETNEQGNDTGGSGGGGGGSVFSRPVAVIVSSPDGVRVDPVFDLTKVALAGLTTGVLILGTLARTLSLRRKIQDVQDDIMKIG